MATSIVSSRITSQVTQSSARTTSTPLASSVHTPSGVRSVSPLDLSSLSIDKLYPKIAPAQTSSLRPRSVSDVQGLSREQVVDLTYHLSSERFQRPYQDEDAKDSDYQSPLIISPSPTQTVSLQHQEALKKLVNDTILDLRKKHLISETNPTHINFTKTGHFATIFATETHVNQASKLYTALQAKGLKVNIYSNQIGSQVSSQRVESPSSAPPHKLSSGETRRDQRSISFASTLASSQESASSPLPKPSFDGVKIEQRSTSSARPRGLSNEDLRSLIRSDSISATSLYRDFHHQQLVYQQLKRSMSRSVSRAGQSFSEED